MTGIGRERPRELKWYTAAGILFGDWGTSRLYVLGLAFVMSGAASFYLVAMVCVFMIFIGLSMSIVCGHFPDGGGVYSTAKLKSPSLGVVGALLLTADYILTASLSTYVAFRYMLPPEIGERWALYFAAVSMVAIGVINFFGLKRAGAFALMITLLSFAFYAVLAGFCVAKTGHAKIGWPSMAPGENLFSYGALQWNHFVNVILAVSGIEAIANMTGVMAKPPGKHARRAIFIVLAEVVILNLIMAYAMNALPSMQGKSLAQLPPGMQDDFRDHMVKNLAVEYVGPAFAYVSSIFFGILLISAANTAIGDMVSIQYLMSRDGELPKMLTRLNRFGMPWIALVLATTAPVVLLLFIGSDLSKLADLYAIGVVGALTLSFLTAGTNWQLELKRWERWLLLIVGGAMALIEVTIAIDKPYALVFALIVLGAGLFARTAAKVAKAKLAPAFKAVTAIFSEEEGTLPANAARFLVPTRGDMDLIKFAVKYGANQRAVLFVLFIREVMISFHERGVPLANESLTLQTDDEARTVFKNAEQMVKEAGLKMVPLYAVSDSPAEVIVDYAATFGVDALIMGISRRGPILKALHGDVLRETIEYLPKNIQLVIHT